MKLIKRLLIAVGIILVFGLTAGYFFLNNIRTGALPDYSEDLRIPGLRDEVVVIRDTFAIPHLYARNERDLYRSTGYVMAQDRMWQMDLLRRVTQGRLSEVMGRDLMNTDLLMRALRIQEKSEKVLAATAPEIIRALEDFSAGVNHYLDTHPLPPEFKLLGYEPEPWQPVHSVNLIGYMAWDLSSGWGPEYLLHKLADEVSEGHLKELTPLYSDNNTPVFPGTQYLPGVETTMLSANSQLRKLGAQIFHGSNNWAVSGEKSITGKPLLANDMHLGFMSPGIWYQMHQVSAGSLNVTGLVLPGQPFVICGHNDSIAWGMTNVSVDDLDFYMETVNEDTTRYLLDGKWADLIIKEERISVREGGKEVHRLQFTHRGPIINRFKGEKETPLSMRWMGNEMSNELRTVFLLNRAADWHDFREAATSFNSVSQNIVYADVNGNIGLQTAAGIPMRNEPGTWIYPGDTSLYDWKGIVKFEDLPYEYNPDRGYVSSANNRTVPTDYPYYIGTWFAIPDRIDRIREMLEQKEKHGVNDFMTMHGDYKSKKAERFVPFFLNALREVKGDKLEVAKARLEAWDYVMDSNSVAASVFEILYRKTAEMLVEDELTDESFEALMGQRILVETLMDNVLESGSSVWMTDKTTGETEAWNNIVQKALEATVDELVRRLGENVDDWQWGNLHVFTMSHPLGSVKTLDKAFKFNRGPFGVPGSYHTVTPYSYSYSNLYEVSHGASHRHIFDLSDWDASKTIIPTGTSGIPASDHYLDQLGLFLKHQYHADPFTRDEVERSGSYRKVLNP